MPISSGSSPRRRGDPCGRARTLTGAPGAWSRSASWRRWGAKNWPCTCAPAVTSASIRKRLSRCCSTSPSTPAFPRRTQRLRWPRPIWAERANHNGRSRTRPIDVPTVSVRGVPCHDAPRSETATHPAAAYLVRDHRPGTGTQRRQRGGQRLDDEHADSHPGDGTADPRHQPRARRGLHAAAKPPHSDAPAAARPRLIARYAHGATLEGYALGFRFDIVLHGPNATPFEPYETAQRATR